MSNNSQLRFALVKCIHEMERHQFILDKIEADPDLIEFFLTGKGIATFNKYRKRLELAKQVLLQTDGAPDSPLPVEEEEVTDQLGAKAIGLSRTKDETYKYPILVKGQHDPSMNGIRYITQEDQDILDGKL